MTTKRDEVQEIILLPTKQELRAQVTDVDDSYLNYLDHLSPEKRERVINSANRTKMGLHNVAPITCLGPEKCPFFEKCPIPDRDEHGFAKQGLLTDYPIGRGCVLEQFFMQQKLHDYLVYLDIDPNNPIEVSLANELATIDLYKNRSLILMSIGDKQGEGRDFMKIDVTGFSESGDASTVSKLHPAAEMLDKLERRREKLLNSLLETRKAKSDWLLKLGDPQKEGKILSEIRTLREAVSELGLKEPLQLTVGDPEEEILLDD